MYKRLTLTSPLTTSSFLRTRAHRSPGKLPWQGEGSPQAKLVVELPSFVYNRLRPLLGRGMELSPPRPDSDTSPFPPSESLHATSPLIIGVQLVCTPARPHCRVILSTYDIMRRSITDSVKSSFQEGGVFWSFRPNQGHNASPALEGKPVDKGSPRYSLWSMGLTPLPSI